MLYIYLFYPFYFYWKGDREAATAAAGRALRELAVEFGPLGVDLDNVK